MVLINQIKSKISSAYVVNIIFITIIFILCLWDIGSLERIRVVDDGFCYWGIAATISGYDWSDLMASSAYYSYGYSLILIPLFWLHRLGISMTVLYRMAIVLNAFFLSGCYLMVLYMIRELFKNIPDVLKQIISIFVILYIGNTAQMGLAWTETFLLFMFWCVVVFLYRVIRKPGYWNILGLVFTTAWMFAIHMRSIGVVIAVCMVMLGFYISNNKEINKKYVIFTVVMAVVFFGLTIVLKNYMMSHIYLGNAANSTNNVQAGVTRIRSLMSIKGLMDLAVSVLGKLFYVSAASFLLIIVGALSTFCYLIGSIRKKKGFGRRLKWQSKEWMLLFILLSFLAEIGIEAIFQCIPFFRTAKSQMRYDTFAYGRYADFVMGPMIIIGVWTVYKLREHYKEIMAVLLFAVCTAGIVQFFINIMAFRKKSDTVGFRFGASPWLSMVMEGHKIDFVCSTMMISIGILLAFCVIGIFSSTVVKNRTFGAALLILAAVWSVLGVLGGMDYTEAKRNKEKTVDSVAKILEITGEDTSIYMVGKPNTEVKILQWLLANRSIHTCDLEAVDDIDMNNDIILANSAEAQTLGVLDDGFDFLYDSGCISVYAAPENKYYKDLCGMAGEMAHSTDPAVYNISLSEIATELSYSKSYGGLYYNYETGGEGYMTESMGVVLEDGIYEFVIDMKVSGCAPDTEIGYVTVGDTSGNVQYTHTLSANDFIKEERQNIKLPIKIKDWAKPYIGIYTHGNADIMVSSITYHKEDGCIQLDSDEIADIASFLENENKNNICYVDSDNSSITGFPWWEYGELEYLPGSVVEYKENFESILYLAEKTDMNVIDTLNEMFDQVYETESYIVYDGVNSDQ